VHAGALGALWQAATLGYAGFCPDPDRLILDPHPPPEWRALKFRLRWRGRTVRVELTSLPQPAAAANATAQPAPTTALAAAREPAPQLITEIELEEGEPLPVLIGAGNETLLQQGQPERTLRTSAGWSARPPTGAAADDDLD
jgi:hypothetical protein